MIGGWEYLLGDDGSGFWIGQRTLRRICCAIDGLVPKTLLYSLVFKKIKIKTETDLIRKIYQPNAIKTIASLVPSVEKAAKKGDKTAKDILLQAGNELAVRANLVIQKLDFKVEEDKSSSSPFASQPCGARVNKRFPLVLIGGVFKSKIILEKVKKEIKKFAPKADFIKPKQEPVIGVVKLAIEQIKKHF